jgi:hypothetical protein
METFMAHVKQLKDKAISKEMKASIIAGWLIEATVLSN